MPMSSDKERIRRSFAAAAETYDHSAELQRQVGGELLRRFPLRLPAGLVLDLGAGTGFLGARLAASDAVKPLLMDIALPMLLESRRNHPDAGMHRVCADAERLPLKTASIDQLYSNLAFQWLQTPEDAFVDFRRVLKPDGRLVFATFGPDTLKELKSAWASVDDAVHVNRFLSVDELVAHLQQAGLVSIRVQSMPLQRHYESVKALMQELKGLGAHHVNQAGERKPTTKSELQRMMQHYAAQMSAPGIVASYDILFVEAYR